MKENPFPDGSYAENGSGKFSDIDESTLAYIKWLGCTHIWLTGVIRHSCSDPTALGGLLENNGGHCSDPQFVKGRAGSPYAIQDYYDVNPYLADNPKERIDEFKQLIKRCHDKGLKVMIDFVPNHVARDYGVGIDKSIAGRPGSDGAVPADYMLGAEDDTNVHWKAENDFFYYPGQRLTLPNESAWTKEGKPIYYEFPAKASGNCYSPSPDINDWYETVKINYCDFHTKTWDRMLNVLRYWSAMGVDGFRCDMVELVPASFFQWAIAEIKKEYPDMLFVAEVYSKDSYRKYIREVGFDLLYDKSGLYDALMDIVKHNCSETSQWTPEAWQSTTRITSNWQYLGDLQTYMLNFLENHDELRFLSDFFAGSGAGGDLEFPAIATSLMFNRSAFMLYFGEEVGERGMDREGFSGVNGRTSIFDWWSTPALISLKKMVSSNAYQTAAPDLAIDDFSEGNTTATSNGAETSSFYSQTSAAGKEIKGRSEYSGHISCVNDRRLENLEFSETELRMFRKITGALRFAATNLAIAEGTTYDLCYCNFNSKGFDKDRHFAFLRDFMDETLLVVANFSDRAAEIDINIPEHAFEWLELQMDENLNSHTPIHICVPAYDFKIIRLSEMEHGA